VEPSKVWRLSNILMEIREALIKGIINNPTQVRGTTSWYNMEDTTAENGEQK